MSMGLRNATESLLPTDCFRDVALFFLRLFGRLYFALGEFLD